MGTYYDRVADEAREAARKLKRFAERLRGLGDFEAAHEAEDLAGSMEKLAFDSLMETQPIEIRRPPIQDDPHE